MKLNLIMPMGGSGTRFGNTNFDVPKPLITIYDKPFFYWATQSIARFVKLESLTFVILKDHIDRFSLDTNILSYYPNASIVIIPKVLPGALLTCIEGVKQIKNNNPILFNDCDHLFLCNSFYKFCKNQSNTECNGGLLTFNSNEPRFSYIGYDENGLFKETKEKCVISSDAICGAYFFKNKQLFLEASRVYQSHCPYDEFFVSGVYNFLKNKKTIKAFRTDAHVSFGTPEEYYNAQKDTTYKALD